MFSNEMNYAFLASLMMGVLALVVVWLFTDSDVLFEKPASSNIAPDRKRGFWRWLFICAITVLATNVTTGMTHYGWVDEDATPVRARIYIYTTCVAFLILFILGPVMFRRLGWIAKVGWIIAIVALLFSAKPKF